MALEREVDPATVRRALKSLEADGLIAAEPRRGYRVLAKANDPAAGCPLAYVVGASLDPEAFGKVHNYLLGELREESSRRGWSLLVVSTAELTTGEVLDRLRSMRAFGAAVECLGPEGVEALRGSGIPAVALNSSDREARLDSVVQDDHYGGVLAARRLLQEGCARIAWFGKTQDDQHSLERLGGVTAELFRAGRSPDRKASSTRALVAGDRLAAARRLLSRKERPDGVICLWTDYALAVKRAADELGLEVGRDFRMVGWCPQELLESWYLPAFADSGPPPTVTWSIRNMVETVAARLAGRRANPGQAPLQVKVPVRLDYCGGGNS
jgi:DNA-binding LacI/PurR family transcriptional regulator